jgi:hypothetical protein
MKILILETISLNLLLIKLHFVEPEKNNKELKNLSNIQRIKNDFKLTLQYAHLSESSKILVRSEHK